MDKEKLVYDLALLCVKQCLTANDPSDMEEACDLAIRAFENAYSKISDSINPTLERINTSF